MDKGKQLTRRDVLRLAAFTAGAAGAAAGSVTPTDLLGLSSPEEDHTSQRQRKTHAPGAVFEELNYGSVKPEGWLKLWLERQRDGLTGKIRTIFPPFTGDAWSKDETNEKADWAPWEQVGYWCDGAVRCAIALQDEQLLDQALKLIRFTLSHPGKNGYLGPTFLEGPGNYHRWPHVVFFRGVLAWQSWTGGEPVLNALRRHYVEGNYKYVGSREENNIEPMLILYGKTGDRRLLQMAIATWDQFQEKTSSNSNFDALLEKSMLAPGPVSCHGVTYAEHTKLPALLYMYTGERRYLELAVSAQRKVFEHHMLVDGTPSSTEMLSTVTTRDGHETCDNTDYPWNWGYLLMATGDAGYSDRIERATFNAAMGALKKDWRALQYYSCPNQFLASATSDHLAVLKGVPPKVIKYYRYMQRMSYRPSPGYIIACCPGNVNRFLPNYVGRMWMKDAHEDGFAATLYGPCRLKAAIGDEGQQVEIIEETTYPFSNEINFRIARSPSAEFALHLRIPGWCEGARIEVNGADTGAKTDSGSFVTLRRRFAPGDEIRLTLPMKAATTNWPDNGIAIERGPLVYALPIAGQWQTVPDKFANAEFPAWDLTPEGSWDYALVLNDKEPLVHVSVQEGNVESDPWLHPPIRLVTDARRLRRWNLTRIQNVDHRWTFTPPLPDPATLSEQLNEEVEQITLVPYGGTELRLAVFPVANVNPAYFYAGQGT